MMAPTLPAISGSNKAMRIGARLSGKRRGGKLRWTRRRVHGS
jgi:hypothetical protein